MFTPKFVARINRKPLAPDKLEQLKPGYVLRSMRREFMKNLKAQIMSEAFSPRAKIALAKALRIKIGPNSITITATHPAFFPLVKGMESRQMTWLRKAKTPIPIILDSGELIFRRASARSLAGGRWVHPGHKPTNIIERARREARAVVMKRAKEMYLKQLRAVAL